ncbi:DUF2207 domain-containing protein [Superficieibacter electus]
MRTYGLRKKNGHASFLTIALVTLFILLAAPVPAAVNMVRLPPNAARTYEHILSFDSHARFTPDGRMQVQENITVMSLGKEIRRGIFRTLPLSWNRPDGKMFSVDYQIQSVSRNDIAEPYSLDTSGKTLTVRIGNADATLKPGIHRYEIRYQVSNHFSRFADWDELYWNVTGNDWNWPISRASFHLQLPDAAGYVNKDGKDTRLRSIDVYTGPLGAKQHNAFLLADGGVETSQPLKKGEGLTVAYTWPRTILARAPAPQAISPFVHLLLPTPKTSIIWLPLLLMVLYYLAWWRKNVTPAGLKMPPVTPQYSIPASMTPGYLRFITRRIYDDVAFTSDLLGLVAKGGMALSNTPDQPTLVRLPDGNNPRLTADDRALLNILFGGNGNRIDLSIARQPMVHHARKWLMQRCEEKRDLLFLKWGKLVRHCIFLALLIPLICGTVFTASVAILTIPGLLMLLPALILLLVFVMALFKPRETGRNRALVLLFSFLFGAGLIAGCTVFLSAMLPPLEQIPAGYPGALVVAIALCLLFCWLTPRYTQRGLNDLAIAKGLKRYLRTAEKHRHQTVYQPRQTVLSFESLLPAALALGIGKTWANKFAAYLGSVGAVSGAFYSADWSHLHHFNHALHTSSQEMPVFNSHSGSSDSGSSGSTDSGSSGSGSSDSGSSGGGSGGGGGGGW